MRIFGWMLLRCFLFVFFTFKISFIKKILKTVLITSISILLGSNRTNDNAIKSQIGEPLLLSKNSFSFTGNVQTPNHFTSNLIEQYLLVQYVKNANLGHGSS